ncbi:MAG: glycine cleavage system protein GcvH [Opitutales bacterium]
MNLPSDLKYAKTHEWVRLSGELATIGITDHAQSQLGELVFVELPEIGRTVEPEEATAVVESVKAASDVYAPMSGEVVEVNEALSDNPEQVNDDAFGEGWLFRMKVSDEAQLSNLLDADAYKQEHGL